MKEDQQVQRGNGTELCDVRAFSVSTVGGTFNSLHIGHIEYLNMALTISDFVHISLTTDSYAATLKSYEVRPFDVRFKGIESFLASVNAINRFSVHSLGSREDMTDFIIGTNLDVAVVEPRYLEIFQKLNDHRRTLREREYYILLKPRTKVDGIEVSSTALQGFSGRRTL